MSEETCERLWLIWEALLLEVSGDQPYLQLVAEITGFLDLLQTAFRVLGTKDRTIAILSAMEEPTPEQIEMIEALVEFVTPILNGFVRAMFKRGLNRLPTPTGGRPVACTAEEKEVICREVLQGIENGLSAAEAKRRSGRSRGLKAKTMDRIWADRKKSAASKLTIPDAQKIADSLLESFRANYQDTQTSTKYTQVR